MTKQRLSKLGHYPIFWNGIRVLEELQAEIAAYYPQVKR